MSDDAPVMMPIYRVRRYTGQKLLWERFSTSKSKYDATKGDVHHVNNYRETHGDGNIKDRVTIESIMIPITLWELVEEA